MQRRRKSTTSVSTQASSRASRASRLEAVRRATFATLEHLESRQLLSTTSIGVNFGGGGQGRGADDLSATDTAGVVAMQNWNNAETGSGTLTGAVGQDGVATGVNVNYTSGGTYSSINTSITPITGDQKLNAGFIFGNGDVKITGIPFAVYDVYVYELNDGSGRIETTTDSGTGQVFYGSSATPNDVGHVSGNSPETYNYIQATSTNPTVGTTNADYVKFTAQAGSSFEFTTSAPGNGYLNGFEIVQNNSAVLGSAALTITNAPPTNTTGVALTATAANATTFDITRYTDAALTQNATVITMGGAATNGQLTITDNTVAANTRYYYQAVAHSGAQTPTTSPAITTFVYTGTGEGWGAAYYNDTLGGSNGVAPTWTEIDPTIHFDQGGAVPAAFAHGVGSGTDPDNWSADWNGEITAPVTGVYTFYANSDDGIEVTIDGQLLDNNFGALRGNTTDTVVVPASWTAGTVHQVAVRFQNNGGGWNAGFQWQAPGIDKGYIPAAVITANPIGILSSKPFHQRIDLSWNPAAVTGYDLVRATDAAFTQNVTPIYTNALVDGSNNALKGYSDTGLTDGTTYYYQLTEHGVDGSHTTIVTTSAVPNFYAPTNVPSPTVTREGTSDVLVSWNAITDVVSYNVLRSSTFGGTYTPVATNQTGTSFQDNTAGYQSGNYYELQAVNPSGTGVSPPVFIGAGDGWGAMYYAGQLAGTNNAAPGASELDPIIDFSQGGTHPGGTSLGTGTDPDNWSARYDGEVTAPYAGNYTFYPSTDDGTEVIVDGVVLENKLSVGRGNTEDTLPVKDSGGNAVTWAAGSVHQVSMLWQQGGGGWDIHFRWSGPAGVPKGFVPSTDVVGNPVLSTLSTQAFSTQVVLSWTQAAVQGYDIVRATDPAFTMNVTNVATSQHGTTFTDTGLTTGTHYYYKLVENGIDANHVTNAFADVTTAFNAPSSPLPPALTRSATAVTVSWAAVIDVTTYDVIRGSTINGTYTTVASGLTTPGFTDNTAGFASPNFYELVAHNTAGTATGAPAFIGAGDGWDATYYGFRDGNNTHSVDASNALIGFQRVEFGPVDYGNNQPADPGTQGTGNDGIGPANAPPQWTATGANQVLSNPSQAGHEFAARWVAWLQAPVTGYYTFGAASDDGNNVVVYDSSNIPVVLNSNHINDNRGVPSPADVCIVTDHTGARYQFVAGQKYLVQYEFNNGGGGWGAHLSWSASSTPTGSANLLPLQIVSGNNAQAPTPAFVTLDANNPTTGLAKDQSFYTLTANPGDTLVQLSWNSIGADSYKVYALDLTANAMGTPTQLTTLPGTTGTKLTYTATGLTDGHQYKFYVTGVTQSGETTLANATTATVTPALAPPQAPANIVAAENTSVDFPLNIAAGTDNILVTWSASAFADSYTITRVVDGTPDAAPLATGLTVLSYVDNNRPIGHTYTYKVAATNVAGTGTPGTSSAWNLTNGAVEGYYSNQWWYSGKTDTTGINNVGATLNPGAFKGVDNLTAQATINFNSGDQNQPNPGADQADKQPGSRLGSNYSTVFEGRITIPYTGNYNFGFLSDDSSALLINGVLDIKQDGCCSDQFGGTHHFNANDQVSFIYFMEEGGGGHATNLLWKYISDDNTHAQSRQVVPQTNLILNDGVPAAATGVTVAQDGGNPALIDVSFTDNAVNELHYQLLRSTNPSMTGAIIVSTGGWSTGTGGATVSDGTAASGTTYYYEVVASNLYGQTTSTASGPISITYLAAPTYFTANAGNNDETVLRWVNSYGPGTGIFIESSPDGTTWSPVTTVAPNGGGQIQTYRISGLTAGTVTYYRISGTDGTNFTATSNPAGSSPVDMPTPSAVDFSGGFSPNNFIVKGNVGTPATQSNGNLLLTDSGGGEARTAWSPTPVSVTNFTTTFDYTASKDAAPGQSTADGFTFTLQNDPRGTNAVGDGGGSKAVGGGDNQAMLDGNQIINSISVGVTPYNEVSYGVLFVNGVRYDATAGGLGDLSTSGIDLHSGDTFEFVIKYNGVAAATPSFTATIIDVTNLSHPTATLDLQAIIDTALGQPTTTAINVPGIVGGNTAIAGFTGATGGAVETQFITNWTYAVPVAAMPAPNLTSTVIGDGTVQRSVFNSVTLNFDEAVSLAAGAFTMNKVTTGTVDDGMGNITHPILTSSDVSAGLTYTQVGDGHQWIIWVTPGGILDNGFGDFLDGVFQYTLHSAKITNATHVALAGGDQTASFMKRYGDIDGDGLVGNIDFGQFKTAYAKSGAATPVNTPKFDIDHDGTVGNIDFGRFKTSFSKPQQFLPS